MILMNMPNKIPSVVNYQLTCDEKKFLNIKKISLKNIQDGPNILKNHLEKITIELNEGNNDFYVINIDGTFKKPANGCFDCSSVSNEEILSQNYSLVDFIEKLSLTNIPLIVVARGKIYGATIALLAIADVVLLCDDSEIICEDIKFNRYPVILHTLLSSKLNECFANYICLNSNLDAYKAMSFGLATQIIPDLEFELIADACVKNYISKNKFMLDYKKSRMEISPPYLLLEKINSAMAFVEN